ncbi:MAG: hypothetical protein ACMUIS_05510 [bacterium]
MEEKKEISGKSTKSEILQAYHEVLERLQRDQVPDRQAERKQAEEKRLVREASQHSVERIVKGLAQIKLEIGGALDNLEERLIAEFKKLSDLQQAIEIGRRTLEEIHDITVNADSLAALLQAQKEKNAQFAKEMEEKRNAFDAELGQKRLEWRREQEAHEQSVKERDARLKKEREREEEEYAYSLQLKRKKEHDAYEAKKAALDKELAEKRATVDRELSDREAALSAREKEYEELKATVTQFPERMQKAIQDTEKSVTEKLDSRYRHEAALAAKEIEGERRLHAQIVSGLEAKIKEQETYIRQLTQKSDDAGKQVQNIAIKAIEGASAQRLLSKHFEVAKESAKEQ